MHYLWSAILNIIKTEDVLFSGTVLGHMPSGKNNYRLADKKMFLDSKVSYYKTSFMLQMGALMGRRGVREPFGMEVGLIAQVVNQNWRRDVDTILFCDLLQKAGVVENDRKIRFKVINGIDVDGKNPRVEFYLIKL